MTKVIDGAFTGSSFPATYTGPGTLVGNIISDGGVTQRTSGSFTSGAEAVRINLGYRPRAIEIINSTDAVLWKKTVGMAAADALKIDTAVAVDSNSYILFEDGGSGNYNILLHATLLGTGKAISFVVEG